MTSPTFERLMVLDFSRYLPGGYATQPLADWDANVIKVEDTGLGDYARHENPTKHGISYYITALGRNKKSIALNLKDPDVVSIFLELADKADIIVESFRPGVTRKLGIDYETVCARKPRIIHIEGGRPRTGAWAESGGRDMTRKSFVRSPSGPPAKRRMAIGRARQVH